MTALQSDPESEPDVIESPNCGDCGRPITESQRIDGKWRPLGHIFANWGGWPGEYPRCRACTNATGADVLARLEIEAAR